MIEFTFKEAILFLVFAFGVFIVPSFFASWALVEFADRSAKQEQVRSYPIGDCETTTFGKPCENPYATKEKSYE